MAKILPKNGSKSPTSINANIGRQILDIVTSGMYSNPLMVLREYIQNAADSIDEALVTKRYHLNSEDAYIKVDIDKDARTITVTDNGTGVPSTEAEHRLGSLGSSLKNDKNQRGFRGIGRLGGLGYCNSLLFETRSSSKGPVTVVEWNGKKLHSLSHEQGARCDLKQTIRKIASIGVRPSTSAEAPGPFFRVTMRNVHRFHSDVLMDIRKLRLYLSQVAPLPYEQDGAVFQYGTDLNDYFSQMPNYKTYNVYLNNERLVKPYAHDFESSKTGKDRIRSIKKITIQNPETGDIIGLGWIALTSFKSSLPRSLAMRGIRVRHGNIEVGDERFLDHIYTERRFATWHIGEFHLNHHIKPNARRDGFEQNTDYERFLAKMKVLGLGLSKLCRESSRIRGVNRHISQQVSRINETINTSFIDRKHCASVVHKAQNQVEQIEKAIASCNGSLTDDMLTVSTRDIDKLKKKIGTLAQKSNFIDSHINSRKRHIGKHGKTLLRKFCRNIVEIYDNKKPIEKVLEDALKQL